MGKIVGIEFAWEAAFQTTLYDFQVLRVLLHSQLAYYGTSKKTRHSNPANRRISEHEKTPRKIKYFRSLNNTGPNLGLWFHG